MTVLLAWHADFASIWLAIGHLAAATQAGRRWVTGPWSVKTYVNGTVRSVEGRTLDEAYSWQQTPIADCGCQTCRSWV